MKRVIGFKVIRRRGPWALICRLILPGKVPVMCVSRTGNTEYYDARVDQFYKLKVRDVRFVYSFSGTYLQMIRYRGREVA